MTARKQKTPPPQVFRTIKRAKINGVKLYLKKYCDRVNTDNVYFFEVRGSDGSLRKTPNEEQATIWFEQLKNFEQRQLTIQ